MLGASACGGGRGAIDAGGDDAPVVADAGPPIDGPPLADGPVTTRSTPIAVRPGDSEVWVVNPDSDSVTVIDIRADIDVVTAEIPVGASPQSVAIGRTSAYVVNQGSDSVSVIDLLSHQVSTIVAVGTGPYGAAFTPSGRYLYVTSTTSGELHKIDVATGEIIQSFDLAQVTQEPERPQPRGVTVSDDGDGEDVDERVFVTNFLAVPNPGAPRVEGADDGRIGLISSFTVGDGAGDAVDRAEIANPPLNDTGFTASRVAFCTKLNGAAVNDTYCPDPSTTDPNDPIIAQAPQGAFPNLIQNLAVTTAGSQLRLIVPSLGSSPEPPQRFSVNVQALLSSVVLDVGDPVASTINLNEFVRTEPVDAGDPLNRLFFSLPWAVDLHPSEDRAYVVVSGGDLVVRVDGVRAGTPTPVSESGAIGRIATGKNPRGVALDSSGARAYVQNYVGRSVTVIDTATDTVVATVATTAQPAPGSAEAEIQLGKELFNTALGPPAPGQTTDGRTPRFTMSDNGRTACFNCHPFGGSDGITWIGIHGPRRSPALYTSFFPSCAGWNQRIFGWTATESSVQDFERQIEGSSGGYGLIGANGAADGVAPHGDNRGLDSRADALASYVESLSAPRAVADAGAQVDAGRALFTSLGCQGCHHTPDAACDPPGAWSKSTFAYDLPASGDSDVDLVNGQINRVDDIALQVLDDVGTFSAAGTIEIRGEGPAAGTQALGSDGYNAPSLAGAYEHAPYFHDGRYSSLSEVVASGHGGTGALTAPQRTNLTRFLMTIDATSPLAPP
ncbi:MAG TPA: di-heme oxidoredictase family protein [Kofleriaceae bacterium]|nr:di-heme oxidoredictase family protein [Kofleriaceae bacterium]